MTEPMATNIEQIAHEICTTKEYEAWLLWHQGAGYRRISSLLDISFTTTRDRVDRARKKLGNDPRLQQDAA